MVLFLLHNTLGAWWAGKVLARNPMLAASAADEDELRAACAVGDVEWTYLRFVREGEELWRPAAGTFDGWPQEARHVTLLDPCMGSGHFLVFALPILAALRAAQESLPREAAIEAVLRDNLFGLEIDPRCTQIAAFNLALAAWKRMGHRKLPPLHLACSGLSLGVAEAEWLQLAEHASAELSVASERNLPGLKNENLFSDATRRGFERLYDLFAKASILGSLIQPSTIGDLIETSFKDLEPVLAKVLGADSAEVSEMAVTAQGLAKAAEILAGRFTLVATNVPYLGRGKQEEVLKKYSERAHSSAKADLATCFVERCLAFCADGGSTALVTPQNWLFLTTYRTLRLELLANFTWDLTIKLGPAAFEDMNWWAANTALLVISHQEPDHSTVIAGLDVSGPRQPSVKAEQLQSLPILTVPQSQQSKNPDARLLLTLLPDLPLLEAYADSYQGISPADFARFGRYFWETTNFEEFRFWQSTFDATIPFGGRELLLWWSDGLREAVEAGSAFLRGENAWGKRGVVVRQMRHLPVSLYTGEAFDTNCAVIIPKSEEDIPAVWAFCSSDDFKEAVRQVDQKTNVTNATLVKVPFNRTHWRRIAAEQCPDGLPKASSSDPTQWLFDGHPDDSDSPLHVVVARLVGYHWPRQSGCSFLDCPALSADGLETHAEDDGIVPMTALKGRAGAAERIVALLQKSYGGEWSAAKLASILAHVGFTGKSLEDWLRDGFFEQHCRLFHQRPFVWHIWDGLRDGFHALVNYHCLAAPNGEGRRTLEKLLYSYLGDWIDRQRADQKAGVEGADVRVAAAEQLKSELTHILAGEPPYDIFVRWKPLHEQPVGWEPDINDGVRMNIRPFMTAKPHGARSKGACILRTTPNIKWDKDRGKEAQRLREDFPWFWGWDLSKEDFEGTAAFDGNRWNDLHYTNRRKLAARSQKRAMEDKEESSKQGQLT